MYEPLASAAQKLRRVHTEKRAPAPHPTTIKTIGQKYTYTSYDIPGTYKSGNLKLPAKHSETYGKTHPHAPLTAFLVVFAKTQKQPQKDHQQALRT